MHSEATAILGANGSVTVVFQQGDSCTSTATIMPAQHGVGLFSTKVPDYFDPEDYQPKLEGYVSREEYKEVITEVNTRYRGATAWAAKGGLCCFFCFLFTICFFVLALIVTAVVVIVSLSVSQGFQPTYFLTIIPAFFFLPFSLLFLTTLFVICYAFACLCVGGLITAKRKREITEYLNQINNETYTARGVHFRETWPVIGTYYSRNYGRRNTTQYRLAVDITPPAEAPAPAAEPDYPNWVPQAPHTG